MNNLSEYREDDQLSYRDLPLLDDLSYDMYVPDLLHKFLRVTDVLMKLFINQLCYADQFQTTTKYDPVKHPNIGKFSNLVKDIVGIGALEKGSDLKKLGAYVEGWMGPKKRIFFKYIANGTGLVTLFGNLENIESINSLWVDYWNIDELLRSNTEYTAESLKEKTSAFLNRFKSLYVSKITPYIHTLIFHIPEVYEKYGNLNFFSAQGLEKLNDLSTYQYFSSTNKSGEFIKQMLQKDFRLATLGNLYNF